MLHGSRLSKGDSLENLEVLDQPLSCRFWRLFFNLSPEVSCALQPSCNKNRHPAKGCLMF